MPILHGWRMCLLGASTLASVEWRTGSTLAATAAMVSVVVLMTVGGALWEGARPEVVSFGQDLAATLLAHLHRWLKLG